MQVASLITLCGFTALAISISGCFTLLILLSTGAARGFTRGSIFTEDGTPSPTVQEGLIRVPGD